MPLRDEDDRSDRDDPDDGMAHEFEPLFGDLEGMQYYWTDDDVQYAVVVESAGEDRLTLIYELSPEQGLVWVFRSLDASLWGDAMWANNKGVFDVAESAREMDRTLMVAEDVAPYRLLKLLTFDEDLAEWKVFLILRMELSVDENDSSRSDSIDGASHLSDPSLSVESDTES